MKTLHDDRAAVATPASPSSEFAAELALPQSAGESRSPLITAIEIENFKGIGRPLRIDLRPITLLFGRNSAGKSTILHALCYAHEILNHRNPDPHKVEIGGDQIDLGGFRRFVHGHDLDRVVRLRFDLNLDGWRVPDRLVRMMIDADPEAVMDEAMDEIPEEWFAARAPTGFARSGWAAFAVTWDRSADGPALHSYEVGVNGALVGQLHRNREAGDGLTRLAYNVAHPLFDFLRQKVEPPAHAAAAGEATGNGERTAETRLQQAVVVHLPSPIPNWEELLDLRGADLISEGEDRDVFEARVSSMLVGIGDALRTRTCRCQIRRSRAPLASAPRFSVRRFEARRLERRIGSLEPASTGR